MRAPALSVTASITARNPTDNFGYALTILLRPENSCAQLRVGNFGDFRTDRLSTQIRNTGFDHLIASIMTLIAAFNSGRSVGQAWTILARSE
jgi:hypothetical protein